MFFFSDERHSETESQTNEDSSDTQLSSGLNIGGLNHTTIHGSSESIASKPSGKQHTNGTLDKTINHSMTKQNATQKIATSSMLQKQFGSDSKMLVGLDNRPGTPKEKDPGMVLVKGDSTPNSLKHKLSSSSSGSVKKSNNKKARHR